jgi:phosphatidylinositol glycan class O
VSLLLGIPIPFSNLGMIIPEVFLPWQTQQSTEELDFSVEESEGYKGRVTQEFLTALQINAEQLQRYLKTYIKHSDDFPSNVYVSLQNKLAHAQKLHGDVKSRPDSSQAELTDTATAYVEYMRDVKTMCHNVWAKFDDFHINQGIILFSLTVLMTLLTLLDPNMSLTYLDRSLTIAFPLGASVSLISLVVSPLPLELGVNSILDVVLSLSFYPLTLFLVVHSLFLSYHIYNILVGRSLIQHLFSVLNQLSFTFVFSTVVALSCGVSLVSNSFILYEGDMTIFFIQSMLICLIVQRAQCLGGKCTVVQHTDDGEDTQKVNGFQHKSHFSLISILKVSWPLLLAMVAVRLTKLFHACRDLQVECEATSFIQPYHSAIETLGRLADVRLCLSCFGVLSVPLALAVFVYFNGNTHRLSRWLLVCVYTALPLSSLCVCGFWFVQSLPQSTIDSLPHWQHVVLPRVVYALCVSAVVVCIVVPFGKTKGRNITHQEARENVREQSQTEGRQKLGSENIRHRVSTATGTSTRDNDVKRDRVKDEISGSVSASSVPAPIVVVIVSLVALWLPTALVLNDGVGLSAVLLVLQQSLIIAALYSSQVADRSWPLVVLWGLVSSQYFFGFGHHATVVSLRFEAGFVGLHGEMSGLNLLCAGMLVGLNMIGSHLLLSLSMPLLLMCVKSKQKTVPSRQLLVTVLQYIAFHSFKTLLTLLTASLQRRHLMVWGVFSPRFLYEAALLATTDVCVVISYLITSSILNSDTLH